jgi:hypothetical protein
VRVKAHTRKSGSLRSALTEFAPALRPHIWGIQTSESQMILIVGSDPASVPAVRFWSYFGSWC